MWEKTTAIHHCMYDMQMCGLTGCGGQRPSSTVCSRRSLRLVWILVRSVCEGQGTGDTLSRPTFTWRLCMPCGPFWKQHRQRFFFSSNIGNMQSDRTDYQVSVQQSTWYFMPCLTLLWSHFSSAFCENEFPSRPTDTQPLTEDTTICTHTHTHTHTKNK